MQLESRLARSLPVLMFVAVVFFLLALAVVRFPGIVSMLWLNAGSVHLRRSMTTSLVPIPPDPEGRLTQVLGLASRERCVPIAQDVNLALSHLYLERAVAWNAGNSRAQAMLGRSYLETHQYAEAVVSLERAVEVKTTDTFANLWLGTALWRIGQQEAAVIHWRVAMGSNCTQRVRLATNLGHNVLCVEEIKRLPTEVALSPIQRDYVAERAFICAVNGNTEADTLSILEAFFRPLPNGDTRHLTIPTVSGLYALAARNSLLTGQVERAVEMAVISVQMGAPQTYRFEQSTPRLAAYLDDGWFGLSRTLEQLVAQSPDAPDVLFLRGWVYWVSDDTQKAIQVWENLMGDHPTYEPVQQVLASINHCGRK